MSPYPAQPGCRAGVLGLALLAAAQLVDVTYFLASTSDEVRTAYLPDDGFYYLQLAKTYATQGIWSVEGGISLTSGFHPLMAYALAALWAAARPTTSAFVSMGVLFTALLALVATVALICLVIELGAGHTALWAALIVAASPSYVLNSASLMEWPFVVLLAASYALVGVRSQRHELARRPCCSRLSVSWAAGRAAILGSSPLACCSPRCRDQEPRWR